MSHTRKPTEKEIGDARDILHDLLFFATETVRLRNQYAPRFIDRYAKRPDALDFSVDQFHESIDDFKETDWKAFGLGNEMYATVGHLSTVVETCHSKLDGRRFEFPSTEIQALKDADQTLRMKTPAETTTEEQPQITETKPSEIDIQRVADFIEENELRTSLRKAILQKMQDKDHFLVVPIVQDLKV